MQWVIVNVVLPTNHEDPWPTFWSTDHGWGLLADANEFSDEQKEKVALPLNGQWVVKESVANLKTQSPPIN